MAQRYYHPFFSLKRTFNNEGKQILIDLDCRLTSLMLIAGLIFLYKQSETHNIENVLVTNETTENETNQVKRYETNCSERKWNKTIKNLKTENTQHFLILKSSQYTMASKQVTELKVWTNSRKSKCYTYWRRRSYFVITSWIHNTLSMHLMRTSLR